MYFSQKRTEITVNQKYVAIPCKLLFLKNRQSSIEYVLYVVTLMNKLVCNSQIYELETPIDFLLYHNAYMTLLY